MIEAPYVFDWENSVEYKLSHREPKRPILNEDGTKVSMMRRFLNALFGSDVMAVYDIKE